MDQERGYPMPRTDSTLIEPSLRNAWLVLAAAVLVLLVTACSAERHAAGSSSSASTDEKFPSESLSDWVSYAQQVSVVTIVSEAQVPPPQEVWDRQEGYVGRTVTVRIERDLWTAPGVLPLRGDQTMLDWGWLLKGERLTPLTSAMQVGQRYVVPLGVSQGKLGSILTTPIGVD